MNSLQQLGTIEIIRNLNWNDTIKLFTEARDYLVKKIDNLKQEVSANYQLKLDEYQKTAQLARDIIANANDDNDLRETWWKRLLETEAKIEKIADEKNAIVKPEMEKNEKKKKILDNLIVVGEFAIVAVGLARLAWDIYNKSKK